MSKTILRPGGPGPRIGVLAGVLLSLIAALAVMVSCDGGGSVPPPPADNPRTVRPTPPRSADPVTAERAAAERAVLQTYRGMQQAVTRALATPEDAHPELQEYAKDKALAGIYQTLYFYEKN